MTHTKSRGFGDRMIETPSSNTGSITQVEHKQLICEGLEVGIDYFTGTQWLQPGTKVEDTIKPWMELLNDEPIWEYNQGHYMGKQWHHKGRSVKGMKWWWTDPEENAGKVHMRVSLSGQVMAQIGIREFYEFSKNVLIPQDFKVTRIDIAIDDFDKSIDEGDIRAAAEAGNFCGVKRISPFRTHIDDGSVQGFTWYIGSRGSDKYARFYDKNVESNGEIDSYRLEGQFEDEVGHGVWVQWLGIPDDEFAEVSPRYLSGSVLGIVDFVERNDDDARRRSGRKYGERLSWWASFIDACGGYIKHARPKADTTLEKSKQWIEKQVFGRMAELQKAMGVLDFRRWCEENMMQKIAEFTKEQKARIAQWTKGKSDVNQRYNGGVDVIDEDGSKWIWVYRNGIADPWTRGKLIATFNGLVRVRFLGEKSKDVPRRICHFGDEKPTWKPSLGFGVCSTQT